MFDAFKRILNSTPEQWSSAVEAGATQMTAKLGAASTIRIYVDNTPNFGNQASSVLLMQTLIDSYGFAGADKTVWMVYHTQWEESTREKLSLLIKGFDWRNPDATAVYGGTTIRFANIETGLAHAAPIAYGFTGGADISSPIDANWYARNLKVRFFLRMQPYLWFSDEQIQSTDTGKGFPLNMNAIAGNLNTFRYRGWHVLDRYCAPTDADWIYYKNRDNPGVGEATARHATLAQSLVEFLTGHPEVRLMPVYGVKGVPSQMGVVADQILPTIIAAALGCSFAEEPKRPVLVVSMNDNISDKEYEYASKVAKGERSASEDDATRSYSTAVQTLADLTRQLLAAKINKASGELIQKLQSDAAEANVKMTENFTIFVSQNTAYTKRSKWLGDRNAKNGVKFYSNISRPAGSDFLPDNLAGALAWLSSEATAKPAVLFVELGALPTILFNRIMSLASYPRVFEGANSTNLSMNLGGCYLRMRSLSDMSSGNNFAYPTANELGVNSYDAAIGECYVAANFITMALFSTATYPAKDFESNIGTITGFLRNYYLNAESQLPAYFAGLRDFYHGPLNGKVAIGLAYMNQYATTGSSQSMQSLPATERVETSEI
ncbi:hypothetical protein MJ904_20845 [Massilia sp. MB5]|uniref:hypothetical protein n=1 Tax=Massilia sp. MB5 TaxID=2919578 RepID=UPI001F0E71D7|nr:hypothetical protein [Massilia sp. MB5]UMR29487.1 hypothetical protein MJ904_20845 [Massilia sp. MB5]